MWELTAVFIFIRHFQLFDQGLEGLDCLFLRTLSDVGDHLEVGVVYPELGQQAGHAETQQFTSDNDLDWYKNPLPAPAYYTILAMQVGGTVQDGLSNILYYQ